MYKKKNERYFIQGQGRISHVCRSGHEGQSCICGKHGEPIHVEGWSTALDGCETHHEVFEWPSGLPIIPRRQEYCLDIILLCGLDGRCQ